MAPQVPNWNWNWWKKNWWKNIDGKKIDRKENWQKADKKIWWEKYNWERSWDNTWIYFVWISRVLSCISFKLIFFTFVSCPSKVIARRRWESRTRWMTIGFQYRTWNQRISNFQSRPIITLVILIAPWKCSIFP